MGSSTTGRLPSKVVLHQRSSSTEGRLPPKVVFNQRSSSTEGRLQPKVIFTKVRLPPTITPCLILYLCEQSTYQISASYLQCMMPKKDFWAKNWEKIENKVQKLSNFKDKKDFFGQKNKLRPSLRTKKGLFLAKILTKIELKGQKLTNSQKKKKKDFSGQKKNKLGLSLGKKL